MSDWRSDAAGSDSESNDVDMMAAAAVPTVPPSASASPSRSATRPTRLRIDPTPVPHDDEGTAESAQLSSILMALPESYEELMIEAARRFRLQHQDERDSMVFVLASGSRLRPNDALPNALLPPTHTDTVIVQCHFKMRASTAPHRKVKEAESADGDAPHAKHIGLTGSSQAHHAAVQQRPCQGKHRCGMCKTRHSLTTALLRCSLCFAVTFPVRPSTECRASSSSSGPCLLSPAESSRAILFSADDGSTGITTSCEGVLAVTNGDHARAAAVACLPLPCPRLFVGPSLHLPPISSTYNRFTCGLAVNHPDGSTSMPHFIVRIEASAVSAWAATRLRSWAADQVGLVLQRGAVFDGDGQTLSVDTLVRVREPEFGTFVLECWLLPPNHISWLLQSRYALTMMPTGANMKSGRMFLVLDMDLTLLEAFREGVAEYRPMAGDGDIHTSNGSATIRYFLRPRGGLKQFMQFAIKYFSICIVSAGTADYIDKALRFIERNVGLDDGYLRGRATSSRLGLHADGSTRKDLRACHDLYARDLFDAFVIVDDSVDIWKEEQRPLVFPITPFDAATSTVGRALPQLQAKLHTFKDAFMMALSKKLDSLYRDGRGVVSLPASGQRVAQHSRVPYAQLSVADKLGVVQTMRPNLVWMTMHTK